MELKYMIAENDTHKGFQADDFNYLFNKETGEHMRWGKTQEDDPEFSPYGPEILDIEITKDGCPDNCPYCYKSNTNSTPKNMTLEQFKYIINLFPKTLTQIALGITGVQSNPDLIPMMQFCREKGIIPNLTLTGTDLTDELAKSLSEQAGAIAVSVKEHDPELGYNTVKRLTDLGMKQINVHLVLYEKSYQHMQNVLDAVQRDKRLEKLNAVVFLSVKSKGYAEQGFDSVCDDKFQKLIKRCLTQNIPFGFDSCTAFRFLNVIKSDPDIPEDAKIRMESCVDPCESSLFSGYINEKGEWWGCSFCENIPEVKPINMLEVKDFFKEVWYSAPVTEFRKNVLLAHSQCRSCWKYNI